MGIEGVGIESIAAIVPPSLAPVMSIAPPGLPGAGPAAPAGFGQLVTDGLDGVNRSLVSAQAGVQSLALGNPVNLHQVMINLEESRLSFQLMMQVRNRLLEAYQDVMRMQV